MRDLARLFVLKEANGIQITNFHVISRVTDLLLKSAAHSEKLEYHKLASQVNEIIKKRVYTAKSLISDDHKTEIFDDF
ncbi:hypothetical protein RhiirA4_473601 [Rhizophagus irregularis]|uniref:Uncharacterized protein n=1 Tax=Rhizophagus irregularis TaxID=588596 RepID=A0A2I1H702_9GLOM|nr:hypothetical protein RhiirA4_473601 [Rhizophagus irregularis]